MEYIDKITGGDEAAKEKCKKVLQLDNPICSHFLFNIP